MTKRKKPTKRKKKSKKTSAIKRWNTFTWLLLIAFFITPIFYFSYKYFVQETKKIHKKSETKKNHLDKKIIEKMNKMLQLERKKVDILKKELEKIKNSKKSIKKESNSSKIVKKEKSEEINTTKERYSSEAVDYKKSLKVEKPKKNPQKKEKIVVRAKKPLLSIIMDDVSSQYEVNKIKSLPFKVTPSIFPPTKKHPNTPKLAKEFDFYMVHVPMEAYNFPHPEPGTLMTYSSLEEIEARMQKIKRWFPKVKFINNHTGSLFTSNYEAMTRLYKVLKEDGIVFVDSRTTAKTVAYEVARSFGEKLLSRKVFLDNKANVSYIKEQLKKAVMYAKKSGYAIAICHPHSETFKALSDSVGILKSVNVVYVKDIYENSSYASK